MIKAVVYLLVVALCLMMFFQKRHVKIGLLLASSICLESVTMPVFSFVNAVSGITIFFILSEIRRIGEWKRTVLKKENFYLFLLPCVSALICLFSSPHLLVGGYTIPLFFWGELFVKWLVIFYSFCCIENERELIPILNISLVAILVATFFGFLNLIQGQSLFLNQVNATENVMFTGKEIGSLYEDSYRFRVQGMFMVPFNYGFVCILMMLFYAFAKGKKLINNRFFVIGLVCCLFGVLSCNCRSVLLCTVISVLVYFMLVYKFTKRIKTLFFALIIFSLAYNFSPYIQEKTEFVTSSFSLTSKTQGSSLGMRAMQYAGVYKYVQQSPLVGKGKGFFNIDLGWSRGRAYLIDESLAGLEGVILYYLLERGILGFALWFLCYLIMLKNLWPLRNRDKLTFALGCSVLLLYFCFSNMNGELSCVFPMHLIMGFCLAFAYKEGKKMRL